MLKNKKKLWQWGQRIHEFFGSLCFRIEVPKSTSIQTEKLRLSVLSEGCQQLQKCGREEEISWHQLKEGEAVRWAVPLQAAWKRGTTSPASQPPALSSVLTAYSSQTQLQFEFVFQRSKWTLLWTCWSSDTFRTGVLEQIYCQADLLSTQLTSVVIGCLL